MPEIMIFYFGGLAVSVLVAIGFYFAIGSSIDTLVRRVLPGSAGGVWSRAMRLFLFVTVIIGGLSTQFYGCGGYADYKPVAADRRLMLQKSTEQVAAAMSYGKGFVFGAAGIGAFIVALLARRALPSAFEHVAPRNPDASRK